MTNHPSMIDATLSFAVGKAPAATTTSPSIPSATTIAGKVAAQLQESSASTFSADPGEQREFEERLEAWRDSYRPALEIKGLTAGGSNRDFVYQQMVWHSVQMERAQRREIELIQAASERAVTMWDVDQDLKANELGERLSRKPSIIVNQLRSFAAGTQWLLDRWEGLKGVISRTKTVTAAQYTKIGDLLGTPLDERNEYKATVSAEDCLKVIDGTIKKLRESYPSLCRIDKNERKRVIDGVSVVVSPEQRYNKRCENDRLAALQRLPQRTHGAVEPRRQIGQARNTRRRREPGLAAVGDLHPFSRAGQVERTPNPNRHQSAGAKRSQRDFG